MLISVKLLSKYVITIYGLGSVHEKLGVWIKAVPKSLQTGAPNVNFRKISVPKKIWDLEFSENSL